MRFLALSLFVHLLASALILLVRFPSAKKIVAVKLVSLPEDVPAAATGESRGNLGGVRGSGTKAKAGAMKWATPVASPVEGFSKSTASGFEASVPWQEESGRGRALADLLWRRLEPHLTYPSELSSAGVAGLVEAQIEILDGRARLLSVESDALQLRELVSNGFRRALIDSFPTGERQTFRIRIEFTSSPTSLAPPILGRNLYFLLTPGASAGVIALRKWNPLDGKTKPPEGSTNPEFLVDIFGLGRWIIGDPEAEKRNRIRQEEERELLRRKR